jgi:hypothetical protein
MKRRAHRQSKGGNQSFEKFFATFVSCTETNEALERGSISTAKKSLKRPPTEHTTLRRELNDDEERALQLHSQERQSTPLSPPLPEPYFSLIKLQLNDGRWPNLDDVLSCLHIPKQKYFNSLENWEEATYFALAMIRQRCDLFDLLGDSHDRAMTWISSSTSSKQYLKQAREILNTIMSVSTSVSVSVSVSQEEKREIYEENHRKTKGGDGEGGEVREKKKITFDVPIDPYRKLLEQSSRLSYSRSLSAMQSFEHESNDRDQILATQVEEERKKLALSLLNPSMNYTTFLEEVLRVKEEFQNSEVCVFPSFLSPCLSATHLSLLSSESHRRRNGPLRSTSTTAS